MNRQRAPCAIFVLCLLCILSIVAISEKLDQDRDADLENGDDDEDAEQGATENPTDSQRENNNRRYNNRKSARWKRKCISQNATCPSGYGESPLILLSLDGFRMEYLQRNVTPSLKRITECGVRARYMRSIFPTTTFPNHYSIITGLYPESHGIIDNKMYDPKTGKQFSISGQDTTNSIWWEGEPLWVTAEKQGKKTASNFWVGSEAKIKGIRPSYFRVYSKYSKSTWNCRVDTVFSWLELPEDVRPSLIMLYFNQPDHYGHQYGPNSTKVTSVLRKLDSTISYLFSGLYKRNLLGCVNILIVSDHGMTEKSCDRVIPIDKYMNLSSVHYVTGAASRIRIRGNHSEDAVDDMIQRLKCQSPNFVAARKELLPKRYHFSHHRRIEPIVLGPKEGWVVTRSTPGVRDQKFCQGGTHGYNNMDESMQTLFAAHGPAFKQNITVEPFMNTELYNFMADLMNITAAPNNGTRGCLHHLLVTSPPPLQEASENPKLMNCPKVDEASVYGKSMCNCSNSFDSDSLNAELFTSQHLLFGGPSQDFCILPSQSYVSSYNHHLRIPLFVSYTLHAGSHILHLTNRRSYMRTGRTILMDCQGLLASRKPTGSNLSSSPSSCWHHDVRIKPSDSPGCDDFGPLKLKSDIEKHPLFPKSFSSRDEVWLLSNSAPVYNKFEDKIKTRMQDLLRQWAAALKSVNVIMGPCFDTIGHGLWPGYEEIKKKQDVNPYPVPSHYFYVVTRCLDATISNLTSCPHQSLDVIAFVLPHLTEQENCLPVDNYLLYHSAQVKDVELLTGLKFFTSLPIYERLRLITKLPEALWSIS